MFYPQIWRLNLHQKLEWLWCLCWIWPKNECLYVGVAMHFPKIYLLNRVFQWNICEIVLPRTHLYLNKTISLRLNKNWHTSWAELNVLSQNLIPITPSFRLCHVNKIIAVKHKTDLNHSYQSTCSHTRYCHSIMFIDILWQSHQCRKVDYSTFGTSSQ